jgi:hypothetical protein
MKNEFILCFFVGSVVAQNSWPYVTNSEASQVIRPSETLPQLLRVGHVVTRERTPAEYDSSGNAVRYFDVYSVGQRLAMDRFQGVWLGRANSDVPFVFEDGGEIGSSALNISRESPSPIGYIATPYLGATIWRQQVAFDRPETPEIFAFPAIAPGRTNLFVGFKLFENADSNVAYYGWVEVLRESGDATSQLHFGRHAVDYLPNRAIRAGREPERPALVSVVTPESTALSWDPLYTASGFRLERTESLTPPVTWEPVEILAGATNVVIPNSASASALYRLVRP